MLNDALREACEPANEDAPRWSTRVQAPLTCALRATREQPAVRMCERKRRMVLVQPTTRRSAQGRTA